MNCYRIFFITLLILSPMIIHAGSTKEDFSLFKKILDRNSGIKSIESEIEQDIWSGDNPPEKYIGRYRADSKGRFRIDYQKPENQVVINNGSKLYWYYPAENILYELASLKNDIAPKLNPLSEYSKRIEKRFDVKYLGKTLNGFFRISLVYQLMDKINGVNIILMIDPDKYLVEKKTLSDRNGKEYLKEVFSDYKNVNGIYFPMRVDVMVRTEKGIAGNTTYYKKVRLNKKIDKKAFLIKFPADVKKRFLNDI